MGLLTSIRQGKYDAHLDQIADALAARKRIIAANRFYELKVGDRVRFVDKIRPTYLSGVEATVVGKKVKKVIVRLDAPVGRFRGDIYCLAHLIEPVDEE